MWSITLNVRKLYNNQYTENVGTIKIKGGKKLKRTYILCVWMKDKEGNKIYNPIPRKSFDKEKYSGDERLCKYLLKYFGEGIYSLTKALGGKKGTSSFFYGEVHKRYFKREKGDITIERRMAPYLSSTQPIGGRHNYK